MTRVRFLTFLLLAFFFCVLPASAQHQGTLTAGASPTPGLAGYNWYRAPCTGTITGTTCSATGTFAKLNATPTTNPTFTDTTVQAGQQYAWEATAVCPTTAGGCGNGVVGESGPSNIVAAVIPTDKPGSPTNLTITGVQ
jgi:hypothetical protein